MPNKNDYLDGLYIAPILALYGQAPMFLLFDLDPHMLLLSYVLLSVLIYVYWIFNIRLIDRRRPNTQRYLISYATAFVVHGGILLVIPFQTNELKAGFSFAYPLISTVGLSTIVLIILDARILKTQRNSIAHELNEIKFQKLEAENRLLLQQLQPHFLFNALSTLKSLIVEEPDKAANYTLQLSSFLKYSIAVGEKETVKLGEELAFTKNYLDLQQTRFGDALKVTVALEDRLMNLELPIFTLQTLAENSIKHTAFNQTRPLFLKIYNDASFIYVENNHQPKAIQLESGTGLKNLKERYYFFSGTRIEVQQSEQYFLVKIPIFTK